MESHQAKKEKASGSLGPSRGKSNILVTHTQPCEVGLVLLKFGSADRIQSIFINRSDYHDITGYNVTTRGQTRKLEVSLQPRGESVTLHAGGCKVSTTARLRC
jgi:hypothetical protein